jgi:hypothetical protein
MPYSLPDWFQDAVDCADEFFPPACLTGELFSTGGSEAVETGLAIVFRRAPIRADPAAILEPVQSRVQRSMLDLEDFMRAMLDDVSDGVAVGGAEKERLQDEQIEGPLQQVGFKWRGVSLWHAVRILQEIIYRSLRKMISGKEYPWGLGLARRM